jgi:alanine-synthesizing transaminase
MRGVTVDDVYLGNGASELIQMSGERAARRRRRMLDARARLPAVHGGDVSLSGGVPVHYLCDEGAGWLPDLDDIRAKITPRTKGIVVINPNNPTGALYPDEPAAQIVEIARQHQLIVFADEIYDKTLYDGHKHTSIAGAGRRRARSSPSTACPRTTAAAATAPAGWSCRATSATRATTSRA